MSDQWQRRRILIWGKTRPEVSTKYREIVCTGGVFADTKRLVRLYPIPLRYMDEQTIFAKYNWIEADVARNERADSRPESYKIRADGIKVTGKIPTKPGDWSARAEWVMQPENIFQSVEALQERQAEDRTSLGLVQPQAVTKIEAVPVGASETAKFMEKYEEATRQHDLVFDEETGRVIKPLLAPEYRFKLTFQCNDQRCKGHTFSVLDWETDALYFRLRRIDKDSERDAVDKVKNKLAEITGPKKDLFFFLGNIHSHPDVFTCVGFWWPNKPKPKAQTSLFGG